MPVPFNSEKTPTMLDSPAQSDVPLYATTTPPASESHSAQPIMGGNKATPSRRGMTVSSQGAERATGEGTSSTSHPGGSSRHPSVLSRKLAHIRSRTMDMFVPPRPVGQPPGPLQSLRAIVTASCMCTFFLFTPQFCGTRELFSRSNVNLPCTLLLDLNLLLVFIPLSVSPIQKPDQRNAAAA